MAGSSNRMITCFTQLPSLSKSEVLAVSQATLVYLIMGLIHAGPGYLVGERPALHILSVSKLVNELALVLF
jgi:hypothetical protein